MGVGLTAWNWIEIFHNQVQRSSKSSKHMTYTWCLVQDSIPGSQIQEISKSDKGSRSLRRV